MKIRPLSLILLGSMLLSLPLSCSSKSNIANTVFPSPAQSPSLEVSHASPSHDPFPSSLEESPAMIESRFQTARFNRLIYENYYFFKNAQGLMYTLLDAPQDPKPLLKKEHAALFEKSLQILFLVHEEQTEKNKGIPVLIIADEKQIVSYDMGSETLTVLQKYPPKKLIAFLYLYQNTLYYSTISQNAASIPQEYFILPIGSDTPIKVLDDFGNYQLLSIQGERIYFMDYNIMEFTLYSGTWNFQKRETVMEKEISQSFYPFIHEGYLYYGKETTEKTLQGQTYSLSNLYKIPLEDPNGKEELVLKDVTYAYADQDTLFYFSAEDVQIKELDIGARLIDRAVLRAIDFTSGEHTVLYNLPKSGTYYLHPLHCSKAHALFSKIELESGEVTVIAVHKKLKEEIVFNES